MSQYSVCLTTVSKKKDAEKIAKYLVAKRLVACVNVVSGAVSFYRWRKKLRREKEVLLLMKTTSSKIKRLENALKRIHPYELPEFLALPIGYGSKPYLEWISQSANPRAVR